jgi:hypothetical protein
VQLEGSDIERGSVTRDGVREATGGQNVESCKHSKTLIITLRVMSFEQRSGKICRMTVADLLRLDSRKEERGGGRGRGGGRRKR